MRWSWCGRTWPVTGSWPPMRSPTVARMPVVALWMRLRSARSRLPRLRVPASVTVLDSLPLTGNGKVDRRALPAPQRGGSVDTYTPARTPTEHLLADVYAQVLDLPTPPGIHEDFFDLGGHSLLATRAITRIRAALDRDVPLRTLFDHPSIAELATALDQAPSSTDDPIVAQPRHPDRPTELFASFGQQRLWFLSELDPQAHLAYHMLGGATITGPLDPDALQAALNTVIDRHEPLRTTFAYHHDQLWQVIHPHLPCT